MKSATETVLSPAIISLKALTYLKPTKGNEWSVYAYTLNKDLIDDQGNISDFRGVVFPLGSFVTQAAAESHMRTIIETTGCKNMVIAKYAMPIPLTVKPDKDCIECVSVDVNGKLAKLEEDQYKEDKAAFDNKV